MQSLGNIDRSVYATVPDNKLKITDKGKQQAMVCVFVHVCGLRGAAWSVYTFVRTFYVRSCIHK